MGHSREDVRLDTELEIIVHTVYDEDGIMIPAIQDIHMKVLNISATGISLSAEREFKEGMSFYIELELDGSKIKIMPVILRRIKGKGKEWIYGCRLVNNEPYEEQIIRKYIFNAEINKRKVWKD